MHLMENQKASFSLSQERQNRTALTLEKIVGGA